MADRGRPSSYTPELAATICERVASGETLVSICKEEGFPHIATVLRWPQADFREMYARAKELRLEVMAEELRELSDVCRIGEKVTVEDGTDDKGQPRTKTITVTADMIERAKLQVDTRKWLLARLAAKTYGDRITQEHTGADGKPLEYIVRHVLTPPAKALLPGDESETKE